MCRPATHGNASIRRRPKNNGGIRRQLVTAVTATEAGSEHAGWAADTGTIANSIPVLPKRAGAYPLKGPARTIPRSETPMTASSPNVIEVKLDRLIDDMRLLRSQMIAFDRQIKGIEACLKPSEPSEQQPESKSRPWFAAAASATARTVLILFAVGAATGAALLYLGT
jgi:hypothetical protein